MQIDHIHFFVVDAEASRHWFTQTLGFQAIAHGKNAHTQTVVMEQGGIRFVLSSPLTAASPVAQFLQSHPPGVADLAFQVQDAATLTGVMARLAASADAADRSAIAPAIQTESFTNGCLQWTQIKGWGGVLRHTLLHRTGVTPLLPTTANLPTVIPCAAPVAVAPSLLVGIDHVVMNVPDGELQPTIQWYAHTLGFQPRQTFNIQTDHSGLRSQVLVHPDSAVQLPINEPASPSSQIQEFLDLNHGAGIQHIALRAQNAVQAIAHFRQRGLTFLDVPMTYYHQQRARGLPLTDEQWEAIATNQILVDWQDRSIPALLLQAFTHPIFEQPTFFFELIERQVYRDNQQHREVQGFGEGNFRALFEAMEQEQIKRGTLQVVGTGTKNK